MLKASVMALKDLGQKGLRRVLLLSLLLTILLLAGIGYGGNRALQAIPHFHWGWLNTVIQVAGDLGLVLAAILLLGPVASLFIGVFLDDVAAAVETTRYPGDPPGRTLGIGPSITTALGFFAGLLLVNLLALPLYLIPGANLAIYFLVNGYVLGREYFELVAFRHYPPREAAGLRKAHRIKVFVAGLVIALALLVPVLNLLAPLFGTAFMVHVFKDIDHARNRSA